MTEKEKKKRLLTPIHTQNFFYEIMKVILDYDPYESQMKLFITYNIQKLYESANNSFRKSELSMSTATAAFGLPQLPLCSAEEQNHSNFLGTGMKPPLRTSRNRPALWKFKENFAIRALTAHNSDKNEVLLALSYDL